MAYYKINKDGTISSANKQHEGFKPLSGLQAKEDGTYATHYNIDGTIDAVKEEEAALKKLIAEGEAIVEAHIQEPIDAYNKAHGVKFGNVHNCANYKDAAGYTHQQFCIDIWNFNIAVWEASRAIQLQVLSNIIPQPTAEEFKAMLPVFGA